MKAFSWTDAPHGAIVADGKRLEAAAYGPPPDTAPTLVLLHEGLGCVALWRDFPERLAEATGLGVFVYSRAGYGRSDPVELPRPLDYMTREARFSLPAALDAIGFRRGVLVGHSDGASIAAIHAGERDDARVKRPRPDRAASLHRAGRPRRHRRGEAGLRDRRPESPARPASRPCRRRLPRLERRLARPRLQILEYRGLRRTLADAGPRHPGDGRPIRHACASPRDRGPIARAGRDVHPRQLPPCAAFRTAGCNS